MINFIYSVKIVVQIIAITGLVLGAAAPISCPALTTNAFVSTQRDSGSFPIVERGTAASIFVEAQDWPGVVRVARDLQLDIARVSGTTATLTHAATALPQEVILIGTIGKSALIDQLIRDQKIAVTEIAGKWESFIIQVVQQPLPGVESALVIVGSDKRGTIYGVYDLAEQMGVSPWYWWADVTPVRKAALYLKAGRYVQGPPSVKYRGIFLNDEAPDLTNWIRDKYGSVAGLSGVANYGREFYTNLFELILRIRGNYLWPAMWNNAFNEDDPENPRLADEYGIVMGNSHQEPMLRAQKEWDRRYQRQYGSWNYAKNPDVLENFWREGIRRNKDFESIITIGLRGANDTPMAPGGPAANRTLLEKIVEVQRQMIAEEINPDVTQVPQLWCLYKEVLDFYKDGMRAPDDVTLLWAEDNWGNVRRLPTAEERNRRGGAGIYYHFDYHGGPRSYEWGVNTSPIAKVWDQMSLSKQYGADRIWIVNVGSFKGYEFPMEYFMSLGWNTDRWTHENITEYTRLWAEREFGSAWAAAIAEVYAKFTKYNGRRKPELLDARTYHVVNYREAERVVEDYNAVAAKAEDIFSKLPEAKRDAFYQLVLYPAKACAGLHEMYVSAAKNVLYAGQGRASANDYAEETRRLFQEQTNMAHYYHTGLAGGKWNHFMDQTYIGYTSWNPPPQNSLRAVRLVESEVPEAAEMGVAIEGSDRAWPGADGEAVLPKFDVFNQQRHFIEVFNKGKTPFEFTAATSDVWIKLSETKGSVAKDRRLWVSMDWRQVPQGLARGSIKLTGAGTNGSVTVTVEAFNPTEVTRDSLRGFVEGDGVVSIEPEHYARKTEVGPNRWIKIEDYGRTLSGMRAEAPPHAPSLTPGKDSPSLEYQTYLFSTGAVEVVAITSPTLNFVPGRGLRLAVSFDDQPPQIVDIVPATADAGDSNRSWEESVKVNARYTTAKLNIEKPGYHTLKFWMVDPGVVLQKIVVNTGGLKPSYLGPPESYRGGTSTASATPNQPAGSGAFATGQYRNLFVEAGESPTAVKAKINAAFQQLFHGAPGQEAVYFPAGTNSAGALAYIYDINSRDVRSEGMSYGMMIAVQLNRPAEFNALWNWSKTHMYHAAPEHPAFGYFSWSVKTNGVPNDEMPAPDGEEYFATALYFASGRWGNGNGIYNYRAEADRILTDMRHRKSITGKTIKGTQTAVSLFHPEHKMVRFTPDVANSEHTDASYHLPAFYEVWARFGPEADRAFWHEAAAVSRDYFARAAHPVTGLTPEYGNFDGTPWVASWNPRSGDFVADAWRTAMNWAVDWAWWQVDPRQKELSNRLQKFFEAHGINTYPSQFTLEGKPLGQGHSIGLVAMNATASLAADHPCAKLFVEAFWKAPVPTGQFRYYDGMLYLMGLLHCSGEFRIWSPQ